MKKMPRYLIAALPSLLLLTSLGGLTACTGCATMGERPERILVEVRDANRYTVEGTDYDLSQLAKAVKKTGAVGDTEIRMQSPVSMPPGSLIPALATLQQAGYRKVLLSHPREATAEVKQPGAIAPPPPARPASRRK